MRGHFRPRETFKVATCTRSLIDWLQRHLEIDALSDAPGENESPKRPRILSLPRWSISAHQEQLGGTRHDNVWDTTTTRQW